MEGYVDGKIRDELFTMTVVVDAYGGSLTEKLGRGVKRAEVPVDVGSTTILCNFQE